MTLKESNSKICDAPLNYNEIDINGFGIAEKEFIEYSEDNGIFFENIYVYSNNYVGYADIYLYISQRVIDVQQDYESIKKYDFLNKIFVSSFNETDIEIVCNEVSLKFESIYDYNRAIILLKYADSVHFNGTIKHLYPKSDADLLLRRLTFEEADPQKVSSEIFKYNGKEKLYCNLEYVSVPCLNDGFINNVCIDIKRKTISFDAGNDNGIQMGIESQFVNGFRPQINRDIGMIKVGRYEMYFTSEYDFNIALLYLRYGDYLYDNNVAVID